MAFGSNWNLKYKFICGIRIIGVILLINWSGTFIMQSHSFRKTNTGSKITKNIPHVSNITRDKMNNRNTNLIKKIVVEDKKQSTFSNATGKPLKTFKNVTGKPLKTSEKVFDYKNVGKGTTNRNPYNYEFSNSTKGRSNGNSLLGISNRKKQPLLSKPKHIKILSWSAKWLGDGKQPFRQCDYSNCILTADKRQYNSSDAVLFYFWYIQIQNLEKIRKYRPVGQKWIMHLRESPIRTIRKFKSLQKFNNMFNVTWTYHSKSDIVSNYSKRYLQYYPKHNSVKFNYAQGKSKIVSALASNCHDDSGRLQYIRSLQQFMEVDVYGRCGTLKCSKNNTRSCYKMLEKTYKFYLAFENSLCEEYITEKLWNVFSYYKIVPIVMGGGDYSKHLPPNSYIDIKDFNSPKQLAAHLENVHRNDSLYNKYFSWKQNYRFTTRSKVKELNWPCLLCHYLNTSKNITKVYSNLDKYWNNEISCKKPQDFYKNIDKSIWSTIKKKI